jgi:hypothetical protein
MNLALVLPPWLKTASAFTMASVGLADDPDHGIGLVEDELVNDLMRFVRRYVVMSEAEVLLTAVWAIHTHCFESFEQTPYLSITSPEARSRWPPGTSFRPPGRPRPCPGPAACSS